MSPDDYGGDCFEAALRFVVSRRITGDDHMFTLVHGVVARPSDGLRHVHAWIEIEDKRGKVLCLNVATGARMVSPKDVYYRAGEIDPENTVRYSFYEAAMLAVTTENGGPWDSALSSVQDEAVRTLTEESNEF